jgi:hypothetical protein
MKLRVRKPEAVSEPTPQVPYPIGDELPNSCPQISQMNADKKEKRAEDPVGDHPLGCPLSPLMGAFYLKLLNERVEKTGLAYARFMDDWVILAPTRWKLRAAIRLVNQTLAELHVEQHPDKTFIGRISRGFDFLGHAFTPVGLEVPPQTVERCVKRVSRLYEQGVDPIHIGAYVRRWHRWAKSGLRDSGEGLAGQVLRVTLRAVVALLLRFVPWLALCPAFACQTVGDAADACQSRYRQT